MKFAVLIGDGMGDYPLGELNGKTVLEAANTPNMDWIAQNGRGGLERTIPPGIHPGSDVANLELFGYDTTREFTGRAVFEALSMGRHITENDVAFRVNLVTLEDGRMKDYSAGHITTEEAQEIIRELDEAIGSDTIHFYTGVSYRHLMIWDGGIDSMKTTPPHDIIGCEYEPYLSSGDGSDFILSLMNRSKPVLDDSLINKKRCATGKLPANSLWLWGQGRKLSLKTIDHKFGLRGGVISAVDLVRGIGIAAGLKPVFVPGATGYIDTNYLGKADAALKVLRSSDFVYVHVEAPDEAGHNGDIAMKIKAIEDFDALVVGTVLKALQKRSDMAVLVACDHRTPIVRRTHTNEPVPFAYYGPGVTTDGMMLFSERAAEKGGIQMIAGNRLLEHFIGDFMTV